jgi:hypothetical protein
MQPKIDEKCVWVAMWPKRRAEMQPEMIEILIRLHSRRY